MGDSTDLLIDSQPAVRPNYTEPDSGRLTVRASVLTRDHLRLATFSKLEFPPDSCEDNLVSKADPVKNF